MAEKIIIKNKKLKASSRKWLLRQLKDPYVARAQKEGFRSRAAFKLLEIDKKFKILGQNKLVIDLGAAPGGWSQVAAKKSRKVLAIDLLAMDLLPGVHFVMGDFLEEKTLKQLEELLEGSKTEVILSDMAPKTCGIQKIDHLRIMNLIEQVFEFAQKVLAEGGVMVIKVFQGGAEASFLASLKKVFLKVSHFKPDSSRKESAEMYLIAQGFRASSKADL